MTLLNARAWETASGLTLLACVAAVAVWMRFRKRPTADEIEQARRELLSHSGRLVDGMLLDVCEMETQDGRTLNMLVYSYRIGGVEYECSQDITALRAMVEPANVRVGFPCSVRYQPGNPQNSIVVAEDWSGLRASLPGLPTFSLPAAGDPRRRSPRAR